MTVRIQLARSQEEINLNQENWGLIKRFAHRFQYAALESSFSGACEQAFEAALTACKQKRWTILSQDQVQDDLARLAVYCRGPLINYAISRNEPWTAELIEQRIDIHSLDFQGNTALHTATREGAAYLIPILSAHIDIHKENHKKQTPLELAIQFGKDHVVLELIKKGVNTHRPIFVGEERSFSLTALGFAVMRGEVECMKKLIIDGKCSLTGQYGEIGNILHLAIHFHQFQALDYLLKNHRDTTLIDQKNHAGLTPLILAASLGEQEPIQLLYEAEAYLECEDHQKQRPIHYAALGLYYDTIQLLAALGCKIEPANESNKRPIDLIEKEVGRDAESCKTLLNSLKANKTLRSRFPTPQFQPPKNLIFRGGGPKGIAFVGALNYLYEKGHLASVKRVAGTSAGAITASLIATGYPMDQLQTLLMKTDLMTFLDHPFSLDKLVKDFKKDNSSVFQVVSTLQSVISTASNIYNHPINFIANQLKKLYQCQGLCEGEAFRIWMDEQIQHATGKKYLTFGELAELVNNNSKFKHLHVYGTKIGSDPQIVSMNSQDPSCKDMIISDAIRISMSIPGVFKPHVMHILQKNGNQRSRIPYPDFGSFLDGGMLYNFPIETFDQKQYLTQEDLGPEGKCPKYNKETLGFSLFSSLTPEKAQSYVENIGDLLKGITEVYLGAEEAIRSLNSYNKSRVIEIDVKDVETLSFNMSDQKKKELIASGKGALEAFIHRQTDAPLPPVPIPTPVEGKSGLSDVEKQQIESRKIELTKKREDHRAEYPPYLDHLLERGYIHLYDHLLEMKAFPTRNDREAAIRKFPFSKLSHIILETREVVFEYVTSKMASHSKQILFLIGGTGSGKSTTLCFLRGDSMVLKDDGNYDSKKDATQEQLIGHGSTSCTFLPTVQVFDDLTVVDFPGFSDSNGSLIALGLECALKALVSKYQPKILVLEAITNTENRGAALGELGKQLERLLGKENKQNCILGITKYSQNLNFGKIKAIEEEQRKQRNEPSQEEKDLEEDIRSIERKIKKETKPSKLDKLQEELRELKEEIIELQKKSVKTSLAELSDTPEKKTQRSYLKAKEEELLKQIGLGKKIAFADLENPEKQTECLRALSQVSGTMPVSNQEKLDPAHEKLLTELFEKDESLQSEITGQNFQGLDFDVDTFEKNVLESSLIKTLLASSHPEIGKLLHLPEIDPKIVYYLSKQLVSKCIEKLMHLVIQRIDNKMIENILNEFGEQSSDGRDQTLKEQQKKIESYRNQIQGSQIKLESYICALKGMNTGTLEERWNQLRKDVNTIEKKRQEVEQEESKWSPLQTIGGYLAFGIPFWASNQRKQRAQQEATQKRQATIDKSFDDYCTTLNRVYEALVKLKGIENIVQKKEEIDKIEQSCPISFESFECLRRSIDKQIDQVKQMYGREDWESRISSMENKIKKGDFKDVLPLLYFGEDPSIELIKITGYSGNIRRLLDRSGLLDKDVLVFKKKNKIIILKRYKEQEKRFCSFLKEASFKVEDSCCVEIINQATFEKWEQGGSVSEPLGDRLTQVKKEMRINTQSFLFQTLIRAVVRSRVVLENCFLEEGVVEVDKELLKFKFGKAKWEYYFGNIGEEPSLPSNIGEILNSPCIFWPEKKVYETHLLVLIPETVNGKPFHLDHLSELIRSPKNGFTTQYQHYDRSVQNELGTKTLKSHWILMTRDVISKNVLSYAAQEKAVQEYALRSQISYKIPKALQAVTSILMHYVETGERLYTENLIFCQEKVKSNQWPTAIGGFSSGGLYVNDDFFWGGHFYRGSGCLRRV